MPAPAAIRVGCSGWIYKHWRGAFYPERLAVKRWLDFYTQHFSTVELNNSFYRLPPPENFRAWCEAAPPGFRFAVKANRYLTQAKKLKDCAEPLDRMMASVRALGRALGPILYQLPPRFRLNLDRLESFLALLPRDCTSVFEFREPSWHVPEVMALLDRHGASFCAHDMPGCGSERWAVGPIAYVRLHGAGGKYWGRYPPAVLGEWAEWMQAQTDQGREVWAFFNNDIDAHAIADAQALVTLLQAARS